MRADRLALPARVNVRAVGSVNCARDGRLGVVAGRVLRLALAGHDDGEAVGLRGRPEGAEHLGRHVDHLAHRLPGDLDLGEADGRGGVEVLVVVGRAVDGHAQRVKGSGWGR